MDKWMLKTALKRCVLRCHFKVRKVCESQAILFLEFQTVGAEVWKAQELTAIFAEFSAKLDVVSQ